MSDVQGFRLIAERFCAFVESSDELDRIRFLAELEHHLLALCQAAIELPYGAWTGPDAPESITSEDRDALFQRLSEKLGDIDEYAFVFDPYEDTTPVVASLANDIADIYRDLTGGLALLAAGGPLDRAVWEWRFGFEMNWGRHATHALYALYVLIHTSSGIGADPGPT
jgi:hypothetical protein